MRTNYKRWILLLSILALPAIAMGDNETLLFSIGAGANYTEDTFTTIYRTQLSPIVMLQIDYERASMFNPKINIRQQVKLQTASFNRYWKNHLLYYTDKTFSLNTAIVYRLLFNHNVNQYLSLLYGSALSTTIRIEQYSIGPEYHYKTLYITPLLPTIATGLHFNIPFGMKIEFLHELGTIPGVNVLQIERYQPVSSMNYAIENRLGLRFEVKLYRIFSLFTSWDNVVSAYLDSIDLTGKIFWSNAISLGVTIEI